MPDLTRATRLALRCLFSLAALSPLAPCQAGSPPSGQARAVQGGELAAHAAAPAGAPAVPQPPRALLTPTPHHPAGAPPVGNGRRPQPQSPATEVPPEAAPGPLAPGDQRSFISTAVQPPGAARNIVGEPSAAIHRDTAFMTGNWWAGLSKDSGMTWTHIDPYTRFPAPDGGFCCDQYVLHVPSHDLTLWFLQYAYSNTTGMGRQRLAVSRSRDDLRSDSNWTWYDITPASLGMPPGCYLDFPHLAASNDYLYIATNAYPGTTGTFQAHMVLRMPLQLLRAGGNVPYQFATDALLGSMGRYRFTDGAAGIMFFAAHLDTTTLRIYSWPDQSNTITWYDRDVAAWSNALYTARGPDNREWLAGERVFHIEGAYRVPGEVGFLWGCGIQAGRPWPYVRVERFDPTSNMARIGEHDVWGSRAFHYPSCAVNGRGHVGGTMAFGGNDLYPSLLTFVVDDFQPGWAPLDVRTVRQSSNGPGNDAWGHYFTTQRHPVALNTWVGTGLTIQGGTTRSAMEPRYLWFGRERDEPAWVTVTVQAPGSSGNVPITVHQTDRLGVADSPTPFTLSYAPHQGYALTAPLIHSTASGAFVFDHWEVNGAPRTVDDRSLVVADIGTANDTDRAVYVPVRTLQVRSTNPASGVPIAVSVMAIHGDQNGATSFQRDYKDGQALQLTTVATMGGNPFRRWVVAGIPQTAGDRTANVVMNASLTATAEYWDHTVGTFTSYGQGCAGGNGVLTQSGSGTPEIGLAGLIDPPAYALANGPANASAILVLGFDRTQWGGAPLPLDLTPLGYPGCRLYTDLVTTFARGTNAAGAASVTLSLPLDQTLIGAHCYTQYWGVAGATLRFSNGVDTRLGGNQ